MPYSARARRREDVGRATVIGFAITLALLMSVSLLSLGVLQQPQLAQLKNPSMAGVLESAVGTSGAVLIYIGLIVSVGGGFLAWMLLAAESLFTPAGGGVMPEWLGRQNRQGVPAHALWLTNGMVQLFLIVTLFSKASYLALPEGGFIIIDNHARIDCAPTYACSLVARLCRTGFT